MKTDISAQEVSSEASTEASSEVPTEVSSEASSETGHMSSEVSSEVSSETGHMSSEVSSEVSSETGHMSTENCAKAASCDVQILQLLSTGEFQLKEIYAHVTWRSESWIRTRVSKLKKSGKVTKVRHGRYTLNRNMLTRTELQNAWTVNVLLNLYDRELARLLSAPSIDYEALASVMNALNRCSMVVERTLKRWYLVDRGYDANTRQAVEDAIQKTATQKKADQENAPPEDRVVEVGHFHPDMQNLWDLLPEAAKKQGTVPSKK